MARLFDRAVFTEKLPFAGLRVTCWAYMSVQMGQTMHLGAQIVVMAGLLCLFTVGGDWSIWRREMRPRCGRWVEYTGWAQWVWNTFCCRSGGGTGFIAATREKLALGTLFFFFLVVDVSAVFPGIQSSLLSASQTRLLPAGAYCSFSGLTMSQASPISHSLIQGWDLCPSWKHTAFYIHTMITAKGAVLVQVMLLYYSWLFTEERGFAAVL